MNSLLKFFASLRLTLVLIVMVGILSAVGTFFPQGDEAFRIIDEYGQGVYDLVKALGITDTYSSWWFLMVLALFFLNLAACTVVRLPKVWRMRKRATDQDLTDLNIPRTSHQESFSAALPVEEVA